MPLSVKPEASPSGRFLSEWLADMKQRTGNPLAAAKRRKKRG
jgi:hypothetical protein